MRKTVIPSNYSIDDRTRIFGVNTKGLTPAARHAEQQKYRQAKRNTARMTKKAKPKKKN